MVRSLRAVRQYQRSLRTGAYVASFHSGRRICHLCRTLGRRTWQCNLCPMVPMRPNHAFNLTESGGVHWHRRHGRLTWSRQASKRRHKMTRVRVESFTISLDGYGAGPNQDINNPLGIGGTDLHQWLFPTRTLQRALFGKDGGTTGLDDDFAARGFENVGAWILGRNMFSPLRGPWPDMNWKGWWGDNPPYHVPVFIMTHHARPPIEMEGDTTFHFVTGGIRDALERAREAAGGMDVRVGGGPNTIQQYLRESLIDELHIAIAPVVLGGGERLFDGVDLRALGYECVESVASEKATHVVLRHQGRLHDVLTL